MESIDPPDFNDLAGSRTSRHRAATFNAIRVARVTATLIVDAISPSLIKHVQPEGKLV